MSCTHKYKIHTQNLSFHNGRGKERQQAAEEKIEIVLKDPSLEGRGRGLESSSAETAEDAGGKAEGSCVCV
ncbi:hypothetical protein CEXT_751661 [Caerostris extrusa]|uniref:Uncharacterized protein n=1 Tax=Caerostris extrusa TaxID=172846 RepID=A0AAV4NSI0_CAEEX|nr:hypothetical protein CEXT_751661 [Caerostris extrusa]